MFGPSSAPKLLSGTSTMMEEPMGHPTSAGTASALSGAGKHPQPCFTPKAQSSRVPLDLLPVPPPLQRWARICNPAISRAAARRALFFLYFPLTSQTKQSQPNEPSQSCVTMVLSHGQINVLHNQVLGKKKPFFLSFFLSNTHCSTFWASRFPLSQPAGVG